MKSTVFEIEDWYRQLVVNASFVSKLLFSEALACGNSAALVVLTIIYFTQKRLQVLSLKISSLRSNVITLDIRIESYWLQCACDWKKHLLTQQEAGASLTAAQCSKCTHVKVCTAHVKVGLCDITSDSVTQICLTEFSRKPWRFDLPIFSSEGMISIVTFYLL